jgi:transcriptional regulator of acetoin/glycerol metabolism
MKWRNQRSNRSPSDEHADSWDMCLINLLGHILPEHAREEWLGDLKEAQLDLIWHGWSNWAITLITLARASLLVWCLLRIKYQDLRLAEGRTTNRLLLESFPKIVELIEGIATSPSTVLLTGDWGTGRESIARVIHAKGHRRNKPFVALDCGARPPRLITRELFGNRLRRGCLERANHGSLFLNQVDKLSLDLQSQLLRVLQEKALPSVGGNQLIELNIRLIVASNKDLREEAKQGRFREDLLYRLTVIEIALPSLNPREAYEEF